VFTRADPVLISAPVVGARAFDLSSGLAIGRVGVGTGLTTAFGSTISGGFAAGGVSVTRALGLAIS
jgi:hypothetical protein